MNKHEEYRAEYERLRPTTSRISSTLANTLDKRALEGAGRALGMARGNTVVLESEDEIAVLMDYGIHDYRVDGLNAVERYIKTTPPAPGSDDAVVLQELLRTWYTLIRIVAVERGVGLTVEDLLLGGTHFFVDIGFTATARPGDVMASRFVPRTGYIRTCGAALPVDAATMAAITKKLTRLLGPADVDLRALSRDQQAGLSALVIRTALDAGMSSRVRYAEPGQTVAPSSLSAGATRRPLPRGTGPSARRQARNTPCPCGSGRKSKVCCGRD